MACLQSRWHPTAASWSQYNLQVSGSVQFAAGEGMADAMAPPTHPLPLAPYSIKEDVRVLHARFGLTV